MRDTGQDVDSPQEEPNVHRRSRSLRALRSLTTVAFVPTLALSLGVAFSLSSWGDAWTRPRLDPRTSAVEWTSVSAFSSASDGSRWTAEPRVALKRLRTSPAPAQECCTDGRILTVVSDRLDALDDLEPAELARLEAAFLANVALDVGEPGYPAARRLRGLVLAGVRRLDGQPVAFASFTGGEVSNDHYATYEVMLERGVPAKLVSASRTYADVAGLDGLTAGWVAFSCVSSASR